MDSVVHECGSFVPRTEVSASDVCRCPTAAANTPEVRAEALLHSGDLLGLVDLDFAAARHVQVRALLGEFDGGIEVVSLVDARIGLDHTKGVSEPEREPTIRKVADRLATRFPATPRHRIEGIVAEEYDSLDSGRIRIYIPTLIENSARSRLHRELDT